MMDYVFNGKIPVVCETDRKSKSERPGMLIGADRRK